MTNEAMTPEVPDTENPVDRAKRLQKELLDMNDGLHAKGRGMLSDLRDIVALTGKPYPRAMFNGLIARAKPGEKKPKPPKESKPEAPPKAAKK